jgi:hypothetical protein
MNKRKKCFDLCLLQQVEFAPAYVEDFHNANDPPAAPRLDGAAPARSPPAAPVAIFRPLPSATPLGRIPRDCRAGPHQHVPRSKRATVTVPIPATGGPA